jgi:hypothetical protein
VALRPRLWPGVPLSMVWRDGEHNYTRIRYSHRQENRGPHKRVCTVAYSQVVGGSPYGPTVTILAIDGTPDPLMRKSMYGPGGARLPLAGALALSVVVVPAGLVKVR